VIARLELLTFDAASSASRFFFNISSMLRGVFFGALETALLFGAPKDGKSSDSAGGGGGASEVGGAGGIERSEGGPGGGGGGRGSEEGGGGMRWPFMVVY
jgi:hypothetical protein